MASTLVWCGLAGTFVGLLAAIRPLPRLGLARRSSGLLLAGTGLGVAAIVALLPAPLRRGTDRRHLDAVLPVFHFNEVHRTDVHAPPERVMAAVLAVRPDEIRLFRTLTTIRSFGRRRRVADPRRPILEIATEGGFRWLHRDEGHVVLGTIGKFWSLKGGTSAAFAGAEDFAAFARPGFAKAAIEFALEDEGGGVTRLTTETRILATDGEARRAFAAYWRLIYPGSALLRRSWLAAIKARAEARLAGLHGPVPRRGHARRGAALAGRVERGTLGPVLVRSLQMPEAVATGE